MLKTWQFAGELVECSKSRRAWFEWDCFKKAAFIDCLFKKPKSCELVIALPAKFVLFNEIESK